jgi:dienelactone hydrolase
MTYASEPGSRVPAYLLVPKAALSSKRRAPAVLVLHPTDHQYGQRSSIEQLGPHYWAFARDLAERGFVTLAPAYPLLVNYQPDLKGLGYKSGTMKAIWDNRRGLDLLDSLPFVKRGKYGALGHSLGGHNALYTAAFDDRIQAVVSSCGFDSFLAYYDGNPENWQPGRGWCQERYMPKLAEYQGRLQEIPFDFHELLGVLAPRPLYINAPLEDENFRWRSVDEIVAAATPVYRLYHAAENLRVEHPACPHDFPPEQREQAYQFLKAHLR